MSRLGNAVPPPDPKFRFLADDERDFPNENTQQSDDSSVWKSDGYRSGGSEMPRHSGGDRGSGNRSFYSSNDRSYYSRDNTTWENSNSDDRRRLNPRSAGSGYLRGDFNAKNRRKSAPRDDLQFCEFCSDLPSNELQQKTREAQDGVVTMTAEQRNEYIKWRTQRDIIDRQRIARQLLPGGKYKREWDQGKVLLPLDANLIKETEFGIIRMNTKQIGEDQPCEEKPPAQKQRSYQAQRRQGPSGRVVLPCVASDELLACFVAPSTEEDKGIISAEEKDVTHCSSENVAAIKEIIEKDAEETNDSFNETVSVGGIKEDRENYSEETNDSFNEMLSVGEINKECDNSLYETVDKDESSEAEERADLTVANTSIQSAADVTDVSVLSVADKNVFNAVELNETNTANFVTGESTVGS